MNNSMTERRIHDPQCEDAYAGREEVEFSTEICRERDTKKARVDKEKLNIRESDQKKSKTRFQRTVWSKTIHGDCRGKEYEKGTSRQ